MPHNGGHRTAELLGSLTPMHLSAKMSSMDTPAPPSTAASVEDQFRLDIAHHGLSQQLASVDAAQMRASVLIAALAIVAATLGIADVDGYDGKLWARAAFVAGWFALAICSMSLVFAIWPRRYSLTVTDLGEESAATMTRSVTASVHEQIATNRAGIKWLWRSVRISIVTLVATALAWGALAVWSPT